MSFGKPTIFRSLFWAERAALSADGDCLRSLAAETAIKRCGGSFDLQPLRRLLCEAAENLSLASHTRTAAGGLATRQAGLVTLDDLTASQVRAMFGEVRRLMTLGQRGRR